MYSVNANISKWCTCPTADNLCT